MTQPAQAALAVVSRFANHALSQQIEQAYAAAERARDYAKAAAAIAANECPPGTARDTLIAALAEHEANSERMMRAVLDFGRDHGHLAFAFRYAPDSPSSHGHGAQPRAPRPAADRRRTPARQRPNSGEARR